MSNRLCGYCRQPGHLKPDCDLIKNQTTIIRKHVGRQRKLQNELALMNGIGAGALITAHDPWSGQEHHCIVPTLNFNNFDVWVDWHNKSYSKQIISTLSCYDYSRHTKTDELGRLVRYRDRRTLQIPCYRIDDMSATLVAHFHLDKIALPSGMRDGYTIGWEYSPHSRVISPSDENDVDAGHFTREFGLHERLVTRKGKTYVNAIV